MYPCSSLEHKCFFCYVLTRHQTELQEQKCGQEDLDSKNSVCPFLWCWENWNHPCGWKASRKDTVFWQMPGHQSLDSGVLCTGGWKVGGLDTSALGFCKLNECPLLHKPYVGGLYHGNYGQASFPRTALFQIGFLCWWCTHLKLDLLCSLPPCGKCSAVGLVTGGTVALLTNPRRFIPCPHRQYLRYHLNISHSLCVSRGNSRGH